VGAARADNSPHCNEDAADAFADSAESPSSACEGSVVNAVWKLRLCQGAVALWVLAAPVLTWADAAQSAQEAKAATVEAAHKTGVAAKEAASAVGHAAKTAASEVAQGARQAYQKGKAVAKEVASDVSEKTKEVVGKVKGAASE